MNFTRDEERGHSFVFKQPQTLEEESQCQEAMQNCPVEAIGDDGALVTKLEAEQIAR
jgi:ferredoxin